ncbi:hypothetical protein GCM10007162_16470 [Ignatzschineria ureiclastica]|nr:hypothetical protein GCM10007162_16470 [Ignatzschineria ureiclastica]
MVLTACIGFKKHIKLHSTTLARCRIEQLSYLLQPIRRHLNKVSFEPILLIDTSRQNEKWHSQYNDENGRQKKPPL